MALLHCQQNLLPILWVDLGVPCVLPPSSLSQILGPQGCVPHPIAVWAEAEGPPSFMGPALQRTWDGSDGPLRCLSLDVGLKDKLTNVCGPTQGGSSTRKWVLVFSSSRISPDQGLFVFLPVCLSLRVSSWQLIAPDLKQPGD